MIICSYKFFHIFSDWSYIIPKRAEREREGDI